MGVTLPFLTAYDPPGSSEGSLDPLGLYQIADQLAVQLVPAVRERMRRIRFVTAMAVGAMVTDDLEDDPHHRDASPYLVWEWLVVEGLVRTVIDDSGILNVPGTLVVRRALDQHGYVDARSYLKTARVFGFHGVYKRLASHLGILDARLQPGPNAEALVDNWARDLGLGGVEAARQSLCRRWNTAVKRSLNENPPRTNPRWTSEEWTELATAFAPSALGSREKRFLRDVLHSTDEKRLGALSAIWQLQDDFVDDTYREEDLHQRLEERVPALTPMITAVQRYEDLARSLQDAFDVLKANAGAEDAQGFSVPDVARNNDFRTSVDGLESRFEAAHRALGEVSHSGTALQSLFVQRFAAFSKPMTAEEWARVLCDHHESVQRMKSAEGKRAWFDRIGPDRIFVRQAYREPRRDIEPGRYVHEYRGWPIRHFWTDLK